MMSQTYELFSKGFENKKSSNDSNYSAYDDMKNWPTLKLVTDEPGPQVLGTSASLAPEATKSRIMICPIPECNTVLSTGSIFSHYRAVHGELQYREVTNNEPLRLAFNYDFLATDENCCLGILGFNRKQNIRQLLSDGIKQPTIMRYCMQSDSVVPILIMAFKSTWGALYPNTAPIPPDDDVLIMWFCSVQTVKQMNIKCTLTLFDKKMQRSRNAILPIRSLSDNQDASVFEGESDYYLRIFKSEISGLSCNHKELIFAEVLVT